MDTKEIQTQLSYLRTRFAELLKLCQAEFGTPGVSDEVRNVTQDMLTRLNKLLDILMYEYFENKIFPNLTLKEKEKIENKIQFPIVSKKEDFKSMLGKIGLTEEFRESRLLSLLEQYQSYQPGQEWLKYLRDYANLCHRKLIPQKKRKETSLTIGDVVKISDSATVTMNNCVVNGIPIDELIVDKGTVQGQIDPRLNPRVETQVIYSFEGTDINVLWLCQKSLEEIGNLVRRFEELTEHT